MPWEVREGHLYHISIFKGRGYFMDESEFLKKCLQIPSVSGDEEEFGNFLLQSLKDLGFKTWKDGVGNIIGEVGKGKPVVLLCSHMDTVIGSVPVKVEKGKLYGRGAVDAKGSLCAMVCAVARFAGKKIPKIIVAGIVEEETTSRGINALLDSLKDVNFAIFGEPSGVSRICIASKGRIHLHVTFTVLSGQTHVSAANTHNPIHIAIQFWNKLKTELEEKPFKGKTLYFSVEPNVTVLQGGTATNILPASCEIDIDIRFPFGIKSDQIIKEIEQIITGVQTDLDIQIEHKILSEIQGFRAPKDSKVALALKQAHREVVGGYPTFLRKAGTNFMVFLADKFQIPVVSYGPGDSSLGHTPNEHIIIDEYLKTIDVLEELIRILVLD